MRSSLRKWAGGLLAALLVVLAPGLPHAHLTDPPATPLLRDRHGAFLGQVGSDGDAPLGHWPVAGVPPERVSAAVLAIEDRRFWSHPGVDPLAVGRAIRQNLRAGRRISGASTIAMQVARLQRPGRRTWLRKVSEASTALLLTIRYGRTAILRQYLRLVPYGNRVRGIGYAARRYLDKPVEDLSWAEIAFLSAIPQSPSQANPYTAAGRARARARARRILDLLRADGLLSAAELDQARAELERIGAPRSDARPPDALHVTLDLAERLAADPGAPQVAHATLDLGMQALVAARLREGLAAWRQKGAGNGAVMVVSLPSLEVHAAVGSAGFFDDQWAGAIDYTNTPRYPGSTLKPLLYARALDTGTITPATVLDDAQRGPAGVENADQRYLGPLLPRRALAGSRNVPAVNLLARLGLDAGYDFFRTLGLHSDEHTADHWGLGMAIGGFPVTMRQLAAAYGALATDGRLRPLRWLRHEAPQPGVRVFTPASTRQIASFLSDPIARLPTFPRMGFTEYPFPVAVKTGTSGGYRDAWAAAYSTEWLVVAWVGHPDFAPMNGLTGYRVGANMASTVLRALHAGDLGGLSDHAFPPPEGHDAVEICGLSGQRAGPHCEPVSTERFPPPLAPTEPCGVHERRLVDGRTGRLATVNTPPDVVEEVVVVRLPGRYADWAARAGLVPQLPPGDDTAGAHRLSVSTPTDGAELFIDPEAPPGRSTLALSVAVEPPAAEVLWLHDGAPLELVAPPHTLRWPLERGVHTFQATLPATGDASATVTVTIR